MITTDDLLFAFFGGFVMGFLITVLFVIVAFKRSE